jgi:hypothetical protein
MDLPNLPTESLYKFQALAGLFLVVGTLVYLFKLIDENWRLLIEVETDIKTSNFELELLREHPDYKAYIKDDNTAEQREILIKESLIHANSPLVTYAKSRFQVEGKRKLSIYLTRRFIFLIGLSLLLMFSGFLWGYAGFTRWQFVQDDIDTAIHQQAIQAIKANNPDERTPIERMEAAMRADSSKGK